VTSKASLSQTHLQQNPNMTLLNGDSVTNKPKSQVNNNDVSIITNELDEKAPKKDS